MFTGIIETLGTLTHIEQEGTNVHFTVESELTAHLQIDQSVAHNGVCLTVVALTDTTHTVTAIQETLDLTSCDAWKVGDKLNLERCTQIGSRLDGHIVQGHVDCVGTCVDITELDGSWYYTFEYPSDFAHLLVSKGSIAVNGTSLTVVKPSISQFQVAIIPYTYENTVFHTLEIGSQVNLEFDIVGKYVSRAEEVKRAKKELKKVQKSEKIDKKKKKK